MATGWFHRHTDDHQSAAVADAVRQEDIPSFDYSGFVVGSKPEHAILYGKGEGVLAGVPFVNMVFEEVSLQHYHTHAQALMRVLQVGCSIEWFVEEGTHFAPTGPGRQGAVQIARVSGAANAIMMGERLALNILCRAVGIALRAYKAKSVADAHKWHGRVAATRKTTPGFRLVEKYAVLVGGCDAHRYVCNTNVHRLCVSSPTTNRDRCRMDLSAMVMLKDNAIVSAGSIAKAVAKAKGAAV
jgi:nicotinate-nucleotide pyrophosphorylase (carboxylating)